MNRIRHFTAGLYCRLSKDDGTASESMSIQSQKTMLKQYADDNGIAIYDYYIDDGWSGTNFQRPSFQKMIMDIENEKINCVITKDLSRLGRNYLQSGSYIEMYFPKHNVRYISINDGIDTYKTGYNSAQLDIMPFKNILNEMYAKDTSNKIKSAIQTRMKNGKYIGSQAPFGYKKDPKDKHHLIIDEETSWIVELIFDLSLEGMGTQLIGKEIMKRHIPRPSAFLEKANVKYGLTEENKYVWTHRMVLDILRDPVYCGDLERYRRPTVSFKNDKRVHIPKEDRIVVQDTHEGIVSRETFDLANEMLDKRKTVNKTGTKFDNIFKGLVKCPDCHYALTPKTDRRLKRDNIIDQTHYSCSSYRKMGREDCTQHRINARVLYDIVLEDIQYHGRMALERRSELVEIVTDRIGKEKSEEDNEYRQRTEELEQELKKMDDIFVKMYEDRLSNAISERNFEMMSEKFSEKQRAIVNELNKLKEIMELHSDENRNFNKFADNISQYATVKELTRYVLNQLIDVIYVHEEETVNGEITQKVEIHYKFIGHIE